MDFSAIYISYGEAAVEQKPMRRNTLLGQEQELSTSALPSHWQTRGMKTVRVQFLGQATNYHSDQMHKSGPLLGPFLLTASLQLLSDDRLHMKSGRARKRC
jgi:hypothetical protein